MAVAVPTLNASPAIASVVGNTGAMATPAQKAAIQETFGSVVCSAKYVVMTMRIAATSVTVEEGTVMRIGETATRPSSNPRANPSDRMFNARVSGLPCGIRCRASHFQTPTSEATYRNSMIASSHSTGWLKRSPAWDNWTPKLGVDFQANDELLVYASYSKGFKGGGWNRIPPAISAGVLVYDIFPYGAENVDAYEVGVKYQNAARTMRLNVSAYYNDYSDLQVTQQIPGTTIARTPEATRFPSTTFAAARIPPCRKRRWRPFRAGTSDQAKVPCAEIEASYQPHGVAAVPCMPSH